MSHHADPDFAKSVFENQKIDSALGRFGNSICAGLTPDFSARSFLGGVVTHDYKFARYFSPREHHMPRTLEELKARNDLEVFDLKWDPGETRNPAASGTISDEVLEGLNTKLNALIDAEVGPDDGQDMPGPGLYWKG